jgi:hypothetical protein
LAGNNQALFLFILVLIVVFAATFYLRNILTKRAIVKVVKLFYQHRALRIDSAKTLRELGLEKPDIIHRLMYPRDYKQLALKLMVQKEVIQVSMDGKVYLIEDKLSDKLRDIGRSQLSSNQG